MLDQSWFIKNSIRDVSLAIAIGGGLAILVVLLFLGSLRRTFIIGLSIPIALVVTFFLMKISGLTLNIFSLGGLALGVGMLVDNSIVMLENISRHQKSSQEDATAAAHEGAKEVESALWASAGTNLAAILPFLFISGVAALLFREMVLTISFAMVISLLVALTLVATLSAKLLTIPRSSHIGRFFLIRGFHRLIEVITRLYAKSLGGVLRFRYLVLGVFVACFVAVVPLFNQLSTELLPPVDDHRASIFVRFPPGRTLDENVEVIRKLSDTALDLPESRSTFMVGGGRLYGRGVRTEATIGSVDVTVDPKVDTLQYVRKLNQKVRSLGIPDARIFIMKSRVRGLNVSNANHRRDISVSIRGDNLATLDQLGGELMARIKKIPGVANVDRNSDVSEPEFRVHVDRERAGEFGLTVTEVGNTVRAAVDGVIATQLTRGDRQVDVRVRYAGVFIGSQSDIENLSLFPKSGEIIPLRHIAKVGSGIGPASITREDQARVLQIVADIQGRPLGEVSKDIRTVAQSINLPPGYGIVAGEEEATMNETNRTMALLTALAIFLVFVVMAVQYESLSNPLVIILTVPLALMGGILGLYFTNTPIGATVLLGIILLVGIVVNNAILLVEYIVQQRRDHGASKTDAIREAGRLRLRPILMTSLTTVIALIPIAIGLGEGSEMMRPLGIVVATGLGFATFITLFLTPTLYAVVDDIASFLRRLVFGKRAQVSERRTLGRAHVSQLADGDAENGSLPPTVPSGSGGVSSAEIAREEPQG
jgi:multidrug efflux pump subunit AcrB